MPRAIKRTKTQIQIVLDHMEQLRRELNADRLDFLQYDADNKRIELRLGTLLIRQNPEEQYNQ